MITIPQDPEADLSYLDITFEYCSTDQIQELVDQIMRNQKFHPQRTKHNRNLNLLRTAICVAGPEAVAKWEANRRKRIAA